MLFHGPAVLVAIVAISFAFVPVWVTNALLLLGASITGYVTKYGWDGIEKVLPIAAKIPAMVKPFVTGLLAIAIGMVGAALNSPLPTDVHLWTVGTFGTFAGAVFAWLIHRIQQDQAAKVGA